MRTFWIEAVDPLVFGDGRAAERSRSRPLPPPSQLAGAVRSAAGLGADGRFDPARLPEIERYAVHGPVLARRTDDAVELLWPAPADAAVSDAEDGGYEAAPLAPAAVPEGCETSADLRHGLPVVGQGRAARGAPGWWTGAEMARWLCREALSLRGHAGPTAERRTHARRGTEQRVVEGRSFVDPDRVGRLGLLCRTDAPVADGLRVLGGEQRLSRWSTLGSEVWPELPDAVVASVRAGGCRVVLATPAWFAMGSVPTDLVAEAPSGTRRLAQVSGRPSGISGWNHAKGAPKPVRRLVPAGAVLFLALGGSPDEREAWARRTWLAPASDRGDATFRPRLDGFGLALIGAWDGRLVPLEA